MTKTAVGEPVPDFAAPATGGHTFRLSAHQGKNVVLYFYPKDNTPGCTTEGQEFRDRIAAFEAANALVVGVSRDSLRSHENFKVKHSLSFELISDTEEAVCALFDVIRLKKMYGKEYLGLERSTFLIDVDGNLAREWRGVKVKGHVDDVLAATQTLQDKHRSESC